MSGWVVFMQSIGEHIISVGRYGKRNYAEEVCKSYVIETLRLMITMYIHRMISLNQAKKTISLSPRGIQQMKNDLFTINTWIVDNTLPQECHDEKKMLQILCQK